MGYTTEFRGQFNITPALSDDDCTFLHEFNQTRHFKRNVDPSYGPEGQMYVCVYDVYHPLRNFWDDPTVIDYNEPPEGVPGLWCGWTPSEDGHALVWDGQEKFYNYVEWLDFLIQKVLVPRGYSVSGTMQWRGEDWNDTGRIIVLDNKISVNGKSWSPGTTSY